MTNPALAIPGRMNIAIQFIDAPLANPSAMLLQTPAGAQFNVVGGLTKWEAATIQIAAQLAPMACSEEWKDTDPATVARAACVLASALLNEWESIRQQEAKGQAIEQPD